MECALAAVFSIYKGENMWMSSKELAELLGVSDRTVQRRAKKGEWPSRVTTLGSKGVKRLEINYESQYDTKPIRQCDNTTEIQGDNATIRQQSKATMRQGDTDNDSTKDTTNDTNDSPISDEEFYFMIEDSEWLDKNQDRLSPCQQCKSAHPWCLECCKTCKEPCNAQQGCRLIDIKPAKPEPEKSGANPQPGAVTDTPTAPGTPITTVPDLTPSYHLPEKYEKIAGLRAQLCEQIIQILASSDSKAVAWESIDNLYNTGIIAEELLKIDGNKSVRSLQRRLQLYLDSNKDYTVLAPGYQIKEKGHKVPEQILNDLLKILLHPNRVSIGSAINTVMIYHKSQSNDFNVSSSTLRRAINDWINNNNATWTLAREGVKSYRDKIGMILHRDRSLLNVGDVWVADGHKLAFDIIDPQDNKPKRFMLIIYSDEASRLPIGASLNLTENSQTILSAFRAGVIFTGYTPRVAYQDNGKAFRSKIFTANPDKHDLEKELAGIFHRAKVMPCFAIPYNARAKSVERFFRTMQDNFERMVPSFRGASIADKPAFLQRNEKWIQKLYDNNPLTVDEFKALFNYWIFNRYGITPHKGLNGKTPLEVFKEGSARIPEDRRIQPGDLNFLLVSDKRKISNKGINFNKLYFWHESLMPYIGQEAHIQYDPMDLNYILVYTEGRKKFICQAELVKHLHPMYHLAEDQTTSKAELDKQIRTQRRIEKQHRNYTEKELQRLEKVSNPILLETDQDTEKLFYQKPLISEPTKKKDLDEVIAGIKSPKKEDKNDKDNVLNLENLGL